MRLLTVRGHEVRVYTKQVPPQRLYFSERNRHGRHRLLRVGRRQVWIAINRPRPAP